VTVVVDGESLPIETQASTVAEALVGAGVELDDDDLVSPARDAEVISGMTIVVRHSVPVTLVFGGEPTQVDVVGETVADALVASGIDPAANPTVEPSLDSPLRPNMEITVPDAFVRVIREEAEVREGTTRISDPQLARGVVKTVSQGQPGRVMRLYRAVVAGGVETTPVLTAEHVLDKPSPRVVAVGTAPPASATSTRPIEDAPSNGKPKRVTATGYSAEQPGLSSKTATGAAAKRGVIAVDPRVIPLGTRVYVPGYGHAVAADTGGAIRGNRIDLCFNTVAQARAWGRRTVTILILE
jgi:uncharacterized protein YabE (DUF348 family)